MRGGGGRLAHRLELGAGSTEVAGSIPAWAAVSCALKKKNDGRISEEITFELSSYC